MANLGPIKNAYGAVVSAGTFTSGHVGPQALESLLDIARPDALFIIGVNKAFFLEADFEPVIRDLEARGAIAALKLVEIPMYNKAGHDHSSDKAYALCFRKKSVS